MTNDECNDVLDMAQEGVEEWLNTFMLNLGVRDTPGFRAETAAIAQEIMAKVARESGIQR